MNETRSKFSLWLRRNLLTSELFRERMAEHGVEVSVDTVAAWRSGKHAPRGKAMIAIKAITGGEITADDFVKP